MPIDEGNTAALGIRGVLDGKSTCALMLIHELTVTRVWIDEIKDELRVRVSDASLSKLDE